MSRFAARHLPFRAAAAFVRQHHRHHSPPQGAILCLGLYAGEELVGVGTIGRPVARMADDGHTVEITRLCVLPDTPHAASALIGHLRRLGQLLGYRRVLTYTLPEEGGASLRAAGGVCRGPAGGGEWSRPSRPRAPSEAPARKLRWEWATAP